MDSLIKAIIDRFGTQHLAAQAIGVSQVAISKWALGKTKPSPLSAIAIERATHGAISRSDLRPDLWPPEQTKGEA